MATNEIYIFDDRPGAMVGVKIFNKACVTRSPRVFSTSYGPWLDRNVVEETGEISNGESNNIALNHGRGHYNYYYSDISL